jgi:putative holliday junction resolvase
VQDRETFNTAVFSELSLCPAAGRILALDVGTKKLGVAVSDELQVVARPLFILERKGWKELLKRVISIIEDYDAVALVLGLPFNFDGTDNKMTDEVYRVGRNFSLSLRVPVFLQDERLSTRTAQEKLERAGMRVKDIKKRLDADAATIILQDFLARVGRPGINA